MKSKLTITLVLFLSIAVGIFLRFYKLDVAPSGFYVDEAALGYNAFSVLKTGKDEFGMKLPVIFRSFLDFKTPIYTYLIVPLIPLFGLSVFVTRLPSALFGLLTLPLLFLLIKEISPPKYSTKLALLSTSLLAISPWHILTSRTAYEANLALFFLLLAIYTFYLGLRKPFIFIFSSIFFSISFMAYHAERLIVPVILIFLVVGNLSRLAQNYRRYLLVALLGTILGLTITWPTVNLMKTPGFLSRTSTLNIFSYSRQLPSGFDPSYHGPFNQIVNFPALLSVKEFLSLYGAYFSPRFMFSIGDSSPHSSYPDQATFYFWQLPFYLLGLFFLIGHKKLGVVRNLTLILLLASPLPAALTRDPYTTIRSLPLVIPQLIVISLGLLYVFALLPTKLHYLLTLVLLSVSVGGILSLYSSIFILNNYLRGYTWDYGPTKVVDYINKLPKNLPITYDNSRGESYIHLLFFTQYDPATYQKDNFEVPLAEYYTNMTRNKNKKIGRVTYRQIDWGADTENIKQYLISDGLVLSDLELAAHHLTKIADITNPDGSLSLRIVETNPRSQ